MEFNITKLQDLGENSCELRHQATDTPTVQKASYPGLRWSDIMFHK